MNWDYQDPLFCQINSLKHKTIRDLAFSIYLHQLLNEKHNWKFQVFGDESSNGWLEKFFHKLQELDTPDGEKKVLEFIEARPRYFQLGIYFESLVFYWIEKIIQPPFYIFNFNVYQNKISIGECDCLYYSEETQVWNHLEVGIKYYLQTNQTKSKFEEFLGPLGRDRLHYKVEKVENHQLQLMDKNQAKEEFKKYLSANMPSAPQIENINRICFLKGQLYYPHHFKQTQLDSDFISPNHHHGKWVSQNDLLQLMNKDPEHRVMVLNKIWWISPFHCAENEIEGLMSQKIAEEYIAEYFKKHLRSLMLVTCCLESGFWREVDRFFVVHPNWPFSNSE